MEPISKGSAMRAIPFSETAAARSLRDAIGLAPGIALALGLAVVAMAAHALPGLARVSPMILAIGLGVGFANLFGLPAAARPGVAAVMRRLLRLAIVLLGLQITPARLAEVGLRGFLVVALCLVATFVFTVALGRRLGVKRELAELIAAGTSICGASAVVAANTVSRAEEADVATAIATVTLYGTLSMVLLPLAAAALGLDAHAWGLWAGASIHEIAQVVAAAFQGGPEAGEFGTVAKLARVAMLAPVVLGLGVLVRRRSGGEGASARAPFPWFVVGFLALVALGGLVEPPRAMLDGVALLTTFLLTVALGAMGLVTDVRRLVAEGVRPLVLGACAWVFITALALLLVETIG